MRVLVFGDSIAQGFWDAEGGWVGRLRKYYDTQNIERPSDDLPTLYNLGVSGNSSNELLARVDNETKARNNDEPLAIIFAIGVNDARTKAGKNFSDTNLYRQNLAELTKQAREYSEKILFIGLTSCVEELANPVAWGDTGYTNSRIKEFDTALQDFCEQNELSFVEIFKPFREKQAQVELLPDGVHPNGEGHQFIADLVKPKLEELLNG